jgi:hypothetical protein
MEATFPTPKNPRCRKARKNKLILMCFAPMRPSPSPAFFSLFANAPSTSPHATSAAQKTA